MNASMQRLSPKSSHVKSGNSWSPCGSISFRARNDLALSIFDGRATAAMVTKPLVLWLFSLVAVVEVLVTLPHGEERRE